MSEHRDELRATDDARDLPNPGSEEAIAIGCTCPVIDNHRGKGLPYGGDRLFWYSEGCPVHQMPLRAARPV